MSELDAGFRDRFDALVETAIDALPERFRALIDEVPIVVEDAPTQEQLAWFEGEDGERMEPQDLCGMYVGPMRTERTIDHPEAELECVMLFRVGIVEAAGDDPSDSAALQEQIRITLLHELGHHVGLEEQDLDDLGYA